MYTRDLTCTALVPGSVILQCTAVRSSVVKCRGYRDFGRQIATDGRSLVHAEGPKAGGDRVHGADGRKARLQRCRISNQDAAAAEVRCVFSLHLFSLHEQSTCRRNSFVGERFFFPLDIHCTDDMFMHAAVHQHIAAFLCERCKPRRIFIPGCRETPTPVRERE